MLKGTFIFCVLFLTCYSQIVVTQNKGRESLSEVVGLFEANPDETTVQMLAFDDSLRDAPGLEPKYYVPKKNDSFNIFRTLCSSENKHTVAVFGPQDPISDRGVLEHCFKVHIPYIQATWQPFDPDLEEPEEIENQVLTEEPAEQEETEKSEDQEKAEEPEEQGESEEPVFKKIAFNFYPDANQVATAYAELLKYYNWENFVVLYEDKYGLLRVQKILAEHSTRFPVIIRRLDPNSKNLEVFKELSEMQESRIILDCHESRIKEYLTVAAELNMVNPYQHYIFTTMDATKSVRELTQHRSNFTWLSLTDYDRLKDPQHSLAARVGKWSTDPDSNPPTTSFEMEALMMKDVSDHLTKSLLAANITQGTILCPTDDEPQSWEFGAKLQEKIMETTTSGVTGNISFDQYGRRKDYVLYINEVYLTHMRPIGIWDSKTKRLDVQKNNDEVVANTTSKPFYIMSRMVQPYFQRKKKREPCTGELCEEDEYPDDLYEGFSVDLVRSIFEKLNYTYEFIEEPDISFGVLDPNTKKWNGLIGKLLDKKADLVVCDLTITEARKKLVDFSVPFMSLGISILFSKEEPVKPELLAFLHPYTWETWVYTATAYCAVSIILFICSRISPADWENPQPCDKDPEELENIWNFKNCTWLTMGSIMTQGCDILPKAFGSRWVCSMWWFFAMIVCQTYIAQLAASMTTALESAPINNVEDLAMQSKVLYGAFKSGSTFDFFKNSKDKLYKKMYENMMANPGVLVSSPEAGEAYVLKNKKYAFFMESVTIEYKTRRDCRLKKVGSELDSKDFGIAMPANSPYRSEINRAILSLKENNKLSDIKNKWWTQKYGARECDDAVDVNDVEGDLEVDNLCGAFYVLIGGLFICLFITAAEFINEVRNIVIREQVSHKEVFVKELKASLNFFQLQKPVLRNPSRAPSLASSENSDRSDKSKRRAQLVQNFLEFEKQP